MDEYSFVDAERRFGGLDRLYGAGGSARLREGHVVVTGVYDLGRTPWGMASPHKDLLAAASRAFNKALLLGMADLGRNTRYVEIFGYVNPPNDDVHRPLDYTPFPYSDVPVCTSVDAGPGIGIGAGQVNAALCTPATLRPGAKVDDYEFADPVYPSPAAQRQIGRQVFELLDNSW